MSATSVGVAPSGEVSN